MMGWLMVEKHLAQDLNEYGEGDIVNARIRMVKKSVFWLTFLTSQMGLFQPMKFLKLWQVHLKKV